ncbi:hypothetical protein EMIHUDRAFT_124117, partial [Emiliania huxleyi CCMP1516]|uniref:Protein kinase domain-containing protein n=2 Tax=Emiliania huxleyi TaxID=2903 RepID=A0A0D3J0Y8_EMIH1
AAPAAPDAAAASVPALPAAAAPPAAVPLDELIAATDGFAEARKVGEGGFGRVYRCGALPSLPRVACGFAIKTALVGVGAQGLAELQSEPRGPPLPRSSRAAAAPHARLRDAASAALLRAARLRVLRDAASALHYLHTRSPMILHRDVSAGNILLDERGNGYLADVWSSRAAEATAGGSQQVSHLSTQRIFGKPGYMDSIIMHDGQASQLTDGYALGSTLLVALTGRGALGLLNACDDALEEPDTAESIAAADAGWSAAQAEELARLVVGLALVKKKKRMPLVEALPRLEALVEAAGEMEETAGAEERLCDLCYDAPRSVRFACGHALYCET